MTEPNTQRESWEEVLKKKLLTYNHNKMITEIRNDLTPSSLMWDIGYEIKKAKEEALKGEWTTDRMKFIEEQALQSYRQELRTKVEGMREYCHEDNWQRGCLSCVRMGKQNEFVEDLLTIISE